VKSSFLSKKLVIGVTGVAMLGGASGALAATQGSSTTSSQNSRSQAYVSDLAQQLHVTPSALTAAVKVADSDQINAALAAGHMTQAQATAAKQRIQQSSGMPFGDAGGRGLRGRAGHSETTAASYLGITETTLRSDQKAGQSLAVIATATPGKSVAGLEAAIIAADTTRLDTAVSSGKITSQQEKQRVADLSSRVDALVQRSWSQGAKGGEAHSSSR